MPVAKALVAGWERSAAGAIGHRYAVAHRGDMSRERSLRRTWILPLADVRTSVAGQGMAAAAAHAAAFADLSEAVAGLDKVSQVVRQT
jgi:hypothetical protein